MKLKTYTLPGLCFIFATNIQASTFASISSNHEITEKNLKAHVNFLSSDSLEGRLTGTAGEKLASQYIANFFERLGLEPAGDNGTYFQAFHFISGVSLGRNNFLSIRDNHGVTKRLILNKDWRPLAFSAPLSFKNAELVFAGFGIKAPALGKLQAYNSYKNVNVKNKWVIVYKYVPEQISDEQRHQINPYSSHRYKTFTAKEHGAKGIIFIDEPGHELKNELIPLSFDTSQSNSEIVVLSVKGSILGDLKNIHTLKITGQTDIVKNIQQGRNVLAKLKLTSHSSPMIILGAHMDHLGFGQLGGSRARHDEVGEVHPGADDNASGVASVLEAAAKLCYLKSQGLLHANKDILFAAWSGEEFGILGSSHFVTNLIAQSKSTSLRAAIDSVINLDMVGHLRKNLVIQGSGSSSDWLKIIKNTKRNHSIEIITQADPYLPTDSTSFYVHGLPTLNFFTGAHDDYHTPRDKAENLNYKGMKNITQLLVDLILGLENNPNIMSYQEVQQVHENRAQGFKIYLGTIPDYASADISGVKLSGVAKGSPAEQAGIKSQDVIIELAGKNVHDIYDYTFALNALSVKKPVRVIVLRGDAKVALSILPRYRE